MNTKLKLTKLTVANLDRIRGGDPVCFCVDPPGGCSDEAFRDAGVFTASLVRTQCGATCSG